jgi:DNA-binding MarR family transcriptional regulator
MMNDGYLQVISLVERLHRRFLEVVKHELVALGIDNVSSVQAVMLYNIGDAEMTVGELTTRDCYLGSNVSYNVKKMVENGYLAQERSGKDRRVFRVCLTEKGTMLRDRLQTIYQRHAEMLNQFAVTDEDLQGSIVTLDRLDRFWLRMPDLRARSNARVVGVGQPQPLYRS